MAIEPLAPYQAKWDSIPQTLHPAVLTTLQKVWKVVWNIFSVLIPIIGLIRLAIYGLGLLVNRHILLPASSYPEDLKGYHRLLFDQKCRQRSAHFEIIHQKVLTPDGATLDATLFRHRQANDQTPTTLYFGGNGQLKGMTQSWDWILQESVVRNSPMNLVVFSYRGCGDSTGTFNQSNDLLIDGHSLVQWIRDTLRTPDHLIHFYGVSLGGAIALKTKAATPQLSGFLLNERSFSSLAETLQAHALRGNTCTKHLLLPFALWILRNNQLELDAHTDWNQLQGRKLVVYHPEDPIIPHEGSLARHVEPQYTFELRSRYRRRLLNHHCDPLHYYHNALPHLSNFVFL